MPRLILNTAQSLILRMKLVSDSGSPIVDVLHSDEDLTVRYRRASDTSWQTVTLIAGTASTYASGGWLGIGGGWYELSLPNAAIVPWGRTEIEIQYGDNEPQADAIDAVANTALDAAATRNAIGLAAANMDTQLGAIVARLWTTAELAQMRYRIGVDGSATAPTTNQSNLSVTIRPSVVIDANVPTVDAGLQFAVTQRDDFEDDSEIGPIGPIRIETNLPLLRESNPPRLRFGATQRLGSRLSDVHAIGTAYAEAVVGQSNHYDVYIEIDAGELNKPPGLYGWDIEVVFPDGDVRTLVGGFMEITASMGDNEARDPLNPAPP